MISLSNHLTHAAIAVGALACVSLVAADTADAQSRSRSRSVTVQGPQRGGTFQSDVVRGPGSASVDRTFTANSGRTLSSSRSRQTVATDDGFATTATRTEPRGGVQDYSRETAVTDDSRSRSASLQTSSGRGYQTEVDVSRTETGRTVDRSLTTNGGRSVSTSSVYTRPE
ncbi:MAG: hypothetical protein SGJ21_14260 [Alphaproteobacteria bacterium]|nr:hypothetical protein [Alphaproteobacteria bacterium]